ncbi:hypothetical protein [Phenylobacterium sp. 58.2.17]|uniref:hypothetical protein n=1 Tax=Phenylobacterium sp. 58.2.17 TaxID=2969306 RepID=UPI002263DDA5|nr:hypothetical protein [Phenylobacterium sp. 58.2.17]MCX7586536.1 hypothetical protein [Phenylobacterium sp. 58.2.17]
MSTAILVEIDTISPAGAAETLRFCDRAVRPFLPSDADRPNTLWDDRLAEPPTFRRALFEDITALTPSLGAGGLTLLNADGGLNVYEGHAWNEIRVYRWPEGEPFAAATLELRGLCARPQFDHRTDSPRKVRVDLYDFRRELEKPLLSALYSGGNNGTTVLYEGSSGGLKNRPKPFAAGDLRTAHLPPIQVNAGANVFQLHNGAVDGSEAIFDGGAPAGYADQGDKTSAVFDATLPAAASYITNHARGLIKINGSPVLGLSFGIKGASDGGYVETVGAIAHRLLQLAGVPPERIGASVAAVAAPAPIGVFAADQIETTDLLAWVGRSALVAILPDKAGVYQAVKFGPPAAVADVEIAFDQVVNLAADEAEPEPVAEIRVAWGRIWTTFSSGELKPSVRGTDEAERLAQEYRHAVLADAAVKARYPRGWSTATVETALRGEDDAEALGAQLQAMFGLRTDGTPRRARRMTVAAGDGLAAELGQTVRLRYPPQGINDNFVLIAEEPMRPRRDLAVWTLWG